MRKIYWSKNVLNMRDKVVNIVNTLIHYKTLKQGDRAPMSPRVLRKTDPAYECVRELDFAIGNKDCYNVALTGIFGSGKSSIIKTLLRKHPFKKVLKLSLSRYITEEGKKQFNEKDVERAIFQHILYKSNPNNTPQSKYKKIKYHSHKGAILYALGFVLLILSGLTLWMPDWIDVVGIKNPFTGQAVQEFFSKIAEWKETISATLIIFALIQFFIYVVRRSSKFDIRNIKIKDVSFDVANKKLDFNTLLEELLYYLKAGKYDMVIFEDLDRVDKTRELFLKFREINLLLNESEYYKRWRKRIVFVYAIRDDVFKEEERTKFFDYIVPVIPVVDYYNVSDYLLKNFKAELNEVDDEDIMALGLYIGGMRQLLNVMNEYGVYKRMILRKSLSQTKLLAMTIYKNLYPEDYSNAHIKEGSLFSIFNNKKDFSHILTEKDEKIIADLDKQIENARAEIIKKRKILTEWVHKKEKIIAIIVNGEKYSLNEVVERDDLYHQIETNKVDSYIEEEDGEEYKKPWNFTFNQIINEVDEDGMYGETMSELDNQLYKLVTAKNDVLKKIQIVTDYSLQKIIQTINDSDKSLAIAKTVCGGEERKAEILHAFIRNGYIDDDFKAYLSFTYQGGMNSSNDFEFVHSVLQGVSSDYNLKLENFDRILESLHTNNFSHESILNYSLLKYLLEKNDEVRLDLFVQTARRVSDFIVFAYLYEDIDEKFYERVFDGWNHCINEILKISSETVQKTMLLLFWRNAPQGLLLDDSEKAFLNTMYGVVCENLSVIKQEEAIKTIKEYNLCFEKIRKSDEASKELYEYVLNHSCFSINAENLVVVYGEEYKTSSYTQVLNGNKNILKYINENIVDFMKYIPESDTQESPQALVEILNNKQIDREKVKLLLSKQENKLENLSKVNADAYGLLFEIDKIVPTWDSIGIYYATYPNEKEQVVEYIKKHVDELETSKVQEGEKGLQTLLLTDNDTLSLEQYEKLAKCFECYFETSELANLEDARLGVLLKTGLIEYTKESIEFFMEKPLELLASFIIYFIDEIQNDVEFDLSFSNELSLRLLNSELSLEQKKWLLDYKVVINDGEGKEELAKQVCYYYHIAGIDDNTDVDFVVEALESNSDEHDWKTKIDLINIINTKAPYKKDIEERMIKALRGGYTSLNSLGRHPVTFDKNEENATLLHYLRDKEHNVSKVIPEDNHFKVTFKRK